MNFKRKRKLQDSFSFEGGHDDKYSKITGSHAINDSHADLHHSASHHKLLLEQKEDAEITGLDVFD